jgi:dTDP-4-amino-4,6-dideoxygalactose transaminase
MKVPFIDLGAQYESIQAEIHDAIGRVLKSTAFAGGPFVSRFEENFARFCGTKHAVGVGNGTDALWFALLAAGVGPGDEVITVPNTFIATAEAVSFCGATPVFVDVEERTCTMDPALVERAITPKTKAILPVHLYGQTADMDPILKLAGDRGIPVIEDACQAHGSAYKGRPAGSMGIAGCFSFYPGKNLGAYGEAGAVATNDGTLAERIRMLRDHGQARKYEHRVIGWNGRMDGIQGAVLDVKLRHLNDWNEARRKHGRLYTELLKNLDGVTPPHEAPFSTHVYHIYAIRVKDRDALIGKLGEQGISCGIHYPIPIHLQGAYESLGIGRGAFPVSEKIAGELVSLPMYPELGEERVRHVVGKIADLIG